MRSCRIIVIVAVAGLFAGLAWAGTVSRASQVVALAHDPLPGTWKVTLVPDDDARRDGAREFKDALVFKGGKFSSTALQKFGFAPGPYDQDTRRGGVGGFSAMQISKTGQGKAQWSGFVAAGEVKGNLVWTKKDGTVLNFSYRGSKE